MWVAKASTSVSVLAWSNGTPDNFWTYIYVFCCGAFARLISVRLLLFVSSDWNDGTVSSFCIVFQIFATICTTTCFFPVFFSGTLPVARTPPFCMWLWFLVMNGLVYLFLADTRRCLCPGVGMSSRLVHQLVSFSAPRPLHILNMANWKCTPPERLHPSYNEHLGF